MDSRMQVRPPKGLRERLAAKARARVRLWVDGHQVRYFDTDGSSWATFATPSYPTHKVLETVPEDRDVPVSIGRYSGVHYTTVLIPGGMHRLDWVTVMHTHVEDGQFVQAPGAITSKGPIVIGNDVFVAYEAVITSGVTIGDGAVVGVRAVVTRDVEPYSVVVGNPARHLRFRFDEASRAALLRIRWWDWAEDKVAAHGPQLHGDDVSGFVERHDPGRASRAPCAVCAEGGWAL